MIFVCLCTLPKQLLNVILLVIDYANSLRANTLKKFYFAK